MKAPLFTAAELDRARGRFDVIAAEVPLKRLGREFAGLCPFHAEKSPSFYVVPNKGMFHCFGCGAHGTAIDYLCRTRNLTFVEAVRELLELPQQREARPAPARQQPVVAGEADDLDQVHKILDGCAPVTRASPASVYLATRGVDWRQPALLEHPALYCHEIHRALPALVAPIADSTGVITALQRIWCADKVWFDGGDPLVTTLDGKGLARAPDGRALLQIRKKTLGHMGDGAVRLLPADLLLGIAEGVETALAAARLFSLPVWAACGGGRMGRVWVPAFVERLIIFGDSGDNGRQLAERAVAEHAPHRACEAIFPEPQFGDFNDALLARERRR